MPTIEEWEGVQLFSVVMLQYSILLLELVTQELLILVGYLLGFN